MRKFSHMEQFDHAVNEDFKETKTILLFDYQNRDPLTNQATVYPITMNLIKINKNIVRKRVQKIR